jgi:ElaB/YqjD/DUF883 family membrane-anchored ribosome-binding protein
VNKQSDIEYDVLREDMDKLRSEFSKLGDLLKDSLRHVGDNAATGARRAGEFAWDQTKSKAEDVISLIEEKPVTSAAIAFGVGLLIGVIFCSRK